jgi:hypothetical protein
MMILIGSRALEFYGRLKNRKPDDWDFLYIGPKKRVNGVEYYNAKEGTNEVLFNYSVEHSQFEIDTPYGAAKVAPLEVLKVLKISSIFVEKTKHQWDLQQMEDVKIPDVLCETLEKRVKETEERVNLQKDRFFNKYKINRIMDHDDLHKYVNPSPTYLEILIDPVNPSEDKFLSLPKNKQIEIVREEMLVLALERNLIPKIRSTPYLSSSLIEKFIKVEKSSDFAYLWLSRLSIPGKLKDHPNWLAVWAFDNYNLIIDGLSEWWKTKIVNLSEEFWYNVLK